MPASRRTPAVDDQIDTRDTSFLYISKTKSTGTSWGFVEIGRITHSCTSAFVVATSLNQFRQRWLASSARAWIGKNVKMQQADAGMPLLRRCLYTSWILAPARTLNFKSQHLESCNLLLFACWL